MAETTATHRLHASELVVTLRTDERRGLADEDARGRLTQHGPNELPAEEPVPAWRRFLAQFQDVLVVLLLVATGLSAVLWSIERDSAVPYEAIAILVVVLLNASMGYWQGARAEAAVTALRAMSAPVAAVVRDGERRSIPASQLVPGDIILVEEGHTIPADGRVLESAALQTAEAALTGESLPVAKQAAALAEDVPLGERSNMVFSGTTVTAGHGKAVVTATGLRTEVGHIARLLEATPDAATPLQRELDRTGRVLGLIVVAIAVVMIATIVLVEDVRGAGPLFDTLILGVALAVAAVPEGLPAVVTAVLAIGVQRMATRHAIVRRLAAVETLGSATVIASDKTGTLTKNEMTVRTIVTASGRAGFEGIGYTLHGMVPDERGRPLDGAPWIELEQALVAADRANNAAVLEADGRRIVHGDPTEVALIVAARTCGLQADALDERYYRVGEIPFSSERKLMSTLHRDAREPDRPVLFVKGAPDILLSRCAHEVVGEGQRALTPERRAALLQANEALAEEALRTLGVATRRLAAGAVTGQLAHTDGRLEEELVFVGLIGLIDPPRAEARDAVALARRAGIRPVMITGDHPRTAAVIARELGISTDGNVITGTELDAVAPDALAATVARVSVFARVNPEHKLRIVEALQKAGAVVAMTGDGVNDAPALKKADIGVAMGIAGTDVAKEAADMVLADDNFATIVAAVEEGRAVFDSIRKFLRYLLSSNVGEVLTMFVGVLLAGPMGLEAGGGAVVLPLLATQILWINLVTDGPPALALGVDRAEEALMMRPPRPVGERVITPAMWRGIAFVAVIMAAGTLFVLDASMPGGFVQGHGDLRYAQTRAFTTLMLFQIFNVFNARSDTRSAFPRLFTNRWLWTAVAGSLVLQVAVVHLPWLQQAFGTMALSAWDWAICAAVASSVLWLRELGKALGRARATDVSARVQPRS